MEKESEFTKLSKNLAPIERKKLLEKIDKEKEEEKNLNKNTKHSRKIQYEYAKKIYKKSGFFEKVVIWFMTFFSGKDREDVVIEEELNKIKREIKNQNKNIINFENSSLTSFFAKELIKIWKKCETIKKKSNIIFDIEYYNNFLFFIFEKYLPGSLKFDVKEIFYEEIDNDSSQPDSETSIKIINSHISKYFKMLDASDYSKFNDDFKKIDVLLKIIKFDYEGLLVHFSVNDYNNSVLLTNTADFFRIDKLLEMLFSLFLEISFSVEDLAFFEELKQYAELVKNKQPDKDLTFDESVLTLYRDLIDSIKNIKKIIPIQLIYKYFKKDILYSIKRFPHSNVFLVQYKEKKKKLILKEWKIYIDKMKTDNLLKLIDTMFKGYDFQSLPNFRIDLQNKIKKYSSVKLLHLHTLNIMVEFFRTIYSPKIEHVINHILIDGTFKTDLDRSMLSTAYYNLKNIVQEIEEYDKKFAPNEQWNKKIESYIARLSVDSNFKNMLETTIKEINVETQSFMNNIIKPLDYIREFFNNIVYNKLSELNPLINLDKIKIRGYIYPYKAAERVVNWLNSFEKIRELVEENF